MGAAESVFQSRYALKANSSCQLSLPTGFTESIDLILAHPVQTAQEYAQAGADAGRGAGQVRLAPLAMQSRPRRLCVAECNQAL